MIHTWRRYCMPKRKGKLRKDEYVDSNIFTGERKIKRRNKKKDLF